MSTHKPYPPTQAALGGQPSVKLDDPIIAVFIFLFLLGAITHMTIFQVNLRRGQKFLMSGMLFGFCVVRILALSMRLAWSTHLTHVPIAIAAQIFVAIGVILLYIINIIFAQRLIRASHPHFGWAASFSIAFKLYYASIVLVIIMLVTSIVQSFYTRSRNTLRIDRDVTLFGSTYFAVAAFLPIPLVLLRVSIPIRSKPEKFGQGRFRTKIIVLLFSSTLLTIGAVFRAAIAYLPRPINNPAWYHSKACFYIFDFTIEIIVVALYAIIRVDKRFIVPDNAHGPGAYSGNVNGATENGPNVFTVLSEEEVFDEQPESGAEAGAWTGKYGHDLEVQPPIHTNTNGASR